MKQSVLQYRPQNLNEKFERTILLEILSDEALMESLKIDPDSFKRLTERVNLLLGGRAKILNLMDMIKG